MSDPTALASLLALGIPRQKAIYALKEHNGEVEAAADWCLGVRLLPPKSAPPLRRDSNTRYS